MPRSKLKLMQVTVLVPLSQVHKLDAHLQEISALSIMMRPHHDLRESEVPALLHKAKGVKTAIAKLTAKKPKPKAKANGESIGTVEKSRLQQEWLAGHVTGAEVPIKVIRQAWIKAGFRPDSIYGALAMAVDTKLLTKVKSGVYGNS